MKQKIQTLLEQLNHGLVDREFTIKTALLAALAGENIVLIGPPGTGKSMIARRIAGGFAHEGSEGGGYFEYLLTKFSTPEEIFGPLSITELKKDNFRRNTSGYLPTVHMAFLDEIFKASSSILNALLTILNERIFHNGAEQQHVPLRSLIAASNELPTDQEELQALYDRFLVRSFVGYVSSENRSRLFEHAGDKPKSDKLDMKDLQQLQKTAEAVAIAPEIVKIIQRIWAQHEEIFKEDRRESLSDRRLVKVLKLLRVSAASNGRSEVDFSDVLLLKDCLWNHQDNADKVRELILNTLRAFSHLLPQGDVPAEPSPSLLKAQASSSQTPVKGYRGSGTVHDPLLIGTIEELMGLARPEVGQKGYYFRQTADIDCSGLTSWMDVVFKGHYNGGGHIIQDRDRKNCLFIRVSDQSSITNLKTNGLTLTKNAKGCKFSHCASSRPLIAEGAEGCKIVHCVSDGLMIGDNAIDCRIHSCQAGARLIGGTAKQSRISDCLVAVKATSTFPMGCIAYKLADGSVVERCFITEER